MHVLFYFLLHSDKVDAEFFVSGLGKDVEDHLQNVFGEATTTFQIIGQVDDVTSNVLDVFSWIGASS
jgi:hypothetical protein